MSILFQSICIFRITENMDQPEERPSMLNHLNGVRLQNSLVYLKKKNFNLYHVQIMILYTLQIHLMDIIQVITF